MASLRNIVLTRPTGENEALASRLTSTGLAVFSRPLIQLSAMTFTPELKQQAMNLDQYDRIVFVSKSAVRFGLPLLDQYWPAWPINLTWLAVGEGTAAGLRTWDITAQFPETAGSEGLLALRALTDVRDSKILIVRGHGGRELLATTLRDRGAQVHYFEAYERTAVTWPTWDMVSSDCVAVITSGEILENFLDQTNSVGRLVRLIVPSPRIAERALSLGALNVAIAAGASEQALYDAVLNECRILDG